MKHNCGMQIQDCTDKITRNLAFRKKFRKKGCIWTNLKQFSQESEMELQLTLF